MKISVNDTGTGMDEKVRKRSSSPSSRPGNRNGNGIGAGLRYGIIKNHGGFIDVESRWAKGQRSKSTSRHQKETKPWKKPVREGKLQRPGNHPAGRRRTENMIVMKELLEDLGYQIICAGSGQEARQST